MCVCVFVYVCVYICVCVCVCVCVSMLRALVYVPHVILSLLSLDLFYVVHIVLITITACSHTTVYH